MATVYLKFSADDERARFVESFFKLDDVDWDSVKLKFIDELEDCAAKGGITLKISADGQKDEGYAKFMGKLITVGVTGVRYQKMWKGLRAKWLAIRVKTLDHAKRLVDNLQKAGMDAQLES